MELKSMADDGAGIDARKRHKALEVVERVRSRPVVRH